MLCTGPAAITKHLLQSRHVREQALRLFPLIYTCELRGWRKGTGGTKRVRTRAFLRSGHAPIKTAITKRWVSVGGLAGKPVGLSELAITECTRVATTSRNVQTPIIALAQCRRG